MLAKKFISFVLAMLLVFGMCSGAYAVAEDDYPLKNADATQINAYEAAKASEHDKYIFDFQKASKKLGIFSMTELISFVVESNGLEQSVVIWLQDVDKNKNPMIVLVDEEGGRISKNNLDYVEAKRYPEDVNLIFDFSDSKFSINEDVFISDIDSFEIKKVNETFLKKVSTIVTIDETEKITQTTSAVEETKSNNETENVEVDEISYGKIIAFIVIALIIIAAAFVVTKIFYKKNKKPVFEYEDSLDDTKEESKANKTQKGGIYKVSKVKRKGGNIEVSDSKTRPPIVDDYESSKEISTPEVNTDETYKTDIEAAENDKEDKSNNNIANEENIIEDQIDVKQIDEKEKSYDDIVAEVNSIYQSKDTIEYNGTEEYANNSLRTEIILKDTPIFIVNQNNRQYIIVENKYLFINYKKWHGSEFILTDWYESIDKTFKLVDANGSELRSVPLGRKMKKIYPAKVKLLQSSGEVIYELYEKGEIIFDNNI